jgi:hypothetical protein
MKNRELRAVSSAVLMLSALVVFSGCSKMSDVQDFDTELKDVATDMASRIDSDPSAKGVADARNYFAGKKAELQAKYEKLTAVKLDDAAKNELMSRVVDSQTILKKLTGTHLAQAHADRKFFEALSALTNEFDAAFDPSKVK